MLVLIVSIVLITGGLYLVVGSAMAFDLMVLEFSRMSRLLLMNPSSKAFDAQMAAARRRILRRWLWWPGYAVSRLKGRSSAIVLKLRDKPQAK